MKIGEMFPSKWLRADDIPENGDLVLTIREVNVESVGQGVQAEEKPVLYFGETDKGLVLNKTNAATIARLYGDDTDEWEGKKIALFSTEVDFQGKQTLALRVRMKAPRSAAEARKSLVGAGAGKSGTAPVDGDEDEWK